MGHGINSVITLSLKPRKIRERRSVARDLDIFAIPFHLTTEKFETILEKKEKQRDGVDE